MKKVKIEIKNRWTGSVLFEYEKEDNTIKETLKEAIKNNAELSSADLRGADLSSANLRGAYLGSADLSSANLSSADLRGANLRGAYLGSANLSSADLRGADLSSANLIGAYLRGAELSSADLRGAYLGSANLSSADLRGAYLRGAYIELSDYKIDIQKTIKYIEENSNIRIKGTYINKCIIPTIWSCYWENGLVIKDYEIIDSKEIKEVKKMTVSEICKELGYEVEIIKGSENE